MRWATYEPVIEPGTLSKLRTRWQGQIQSLAALGFTEFGGLIEVTMPFSLLLMVPVAVIAYWNREIMGSRWPLRLVNSTPIMVHHASATYAYIFGMGITLYTRMSDGRGIVTANFASQLFPSAESRIDKSATPQSVPQVWHLHQDRIARAVKDGASVERQMSFELFSELIAREDPTGWAIYRMLITFTVFTGGVFYVCLQAILDLYR